MDYFLYLMDEVSFDRIHPYYYDHVIDIVREHTQIMEFGENSKLLDLENTSQVFIDDCHLIQDCDFMVVNDAEEYFKNLIETMRNGIVEGYKSAFNDPENAKARARVKISRWQCFPPYNLNDSVNIVKSVDWEYLIFNIIYHYKNYLNSPKKQKLVIVGY